METERKQCRVKIAKGQLAPSLGEAKELDRSKDKRTHGTTSTGVTPTLTEQ
jgi:hypothetical protein